MKKIGVIGIGNPLRRDDGIGVFLLKKLIDRKYELPAGIEYVDGGTGYLNLIHDLDRFDIVVFIDAVDFNGKPGDSKIFEYEDIKSKKINFNSSSHGEDIVQVIDFSKSVDMLPERIIFFGVQPKDVSFGDTFSDELSTKSDVLIDDLICYLKKLVDDI